MAKRKNKLTPEEIEREIAEMELQRRLEDYAAQKNFLNSLSINFKCKTPKQKELVRAINSKEVIFCSGVAGTGKTYVACAQALKLLQKNSKYEKIIIAKSVTSIPGEEIGFLKGTWEEKMEPYMWSFWTNFEKLMGKAELTRLRNMGIIEVWPLAFIRGSNVDNTIAIIDESQNITKNTIKTILTRLGKDSKMIFLGDTDQIDLKKPSESCLEFYIKNFKDFEEFGIVEFTEDDVVRNPLISKYLNKLKEIENKK